MTTLPPPPQYYTPLTPEQYERMSKRCWACEAPITKPEEMQCAGCGEFFCGGERCPATEHEMDVPFGRHSYDDHMGDPDEDDEED